jgi:ribosomal protein S18 acetylase RimI-like enzyme
VIPPLLQIQPLQPEQLAQLFLYLDDQLQENGRDGMPLFQPLSRLQSRVPPEKAAAFAASFAVPFGQPGWRCMWLALDGAGNIAGHVDLRAQPDPASSHRALLGMGVHRHYRQLGLGRQLVDTALGWASITPPLEWVDLDVLSVNHAARRLYERAGFVVTGEVPDLYRIDGQSHGSVMMSRRLAPYSR